MTIDVRKVRRAQLALQGAEQALLSFRKHLSAGMIAVEDMEADGVGSKELKLILEQIMCEAEELQSLIDKLHRGATAVLAGHGQDAPGPTPEGGGDGKGG